MTCPICAAPAMRAYDHYAHCASCDYWASDLEPDVENTSGEDKDYELVSYRHTRIENYTTILRMLEPRHPRGSGLLELGCADGLFLHMAAERCGYAGVGVEPNVKMMHGNPHRQDIRRGYFPQALDGTGLAFDIIALNCVFEHLPDLDGMIESFARYLRPGGSIAINVPVSSGMMFRVSRLLYGVGVTYPFDRIWQKGFVSPHLHYFSRDNLEPLFRRHGFALVDEHALAMFSLGGMYRRLSIDPNIRSLQRLTALGALYAYYPASRIAPDARVFLFARAR